MGETVGMSGLLLLTVSLAAL